MSPTKLTTQIEKDVAKLEAVKILFDRAFEESAKHGFSVLASKGGDSRGYTHFLTLSRQSIKFQKAE